MKKGPFIRSKNSSFIMMNRVFVALLPIILFGFYKNGIEPFIDGKINVFKMLYPLIFVFLGGTFTYFIEKMYAKYFLKKKDNELKDYMKHSFAALPGIFLALILPLNTPIWLLLIGAFISIVLGKLAYGGFGKNMFNPALLGKLFIIVIFSSIIKSTTEITPLPNMYMVNEIGNYESLGAPYDTLKNFFIGNIPGTIGETSILLSIIAFIYLSCTRVIKRKIPIIYILTVFISTWIIGKINCLDIWYPLFQICSGGIIFSAVFMATDPVTSPVTPIGQVLYGIGLGILTVIFRYLLPIEEGALISILIMNMLVSILDIFGSHARGRAMHYGFVFVTIILIGVFISNYIGHSYKKNIKLTSNNEFIQIT